MKKLIILLIATLPLSALAQTKPDTAHSIKVRMNEAQWMLNNLQKAQVKLHRLRMDALDRDSIDSYINSAYILERRLRVLADSLGRGKK